MKPLLLSPINDSVAAVTHENEALLYALIRYCIDSIYGYCLRHHNGTRIRTRIRTRSIVRVVYQNLRFDGDFLQATKCAFRSSPNRNFVDDSCHPRSLLAYSYFRASIEQPTKPHTAFLRRLVGRILVRRPPDLPDLLLRPCNIINNVKVTIIRQYTECR